MMILADLNHCPPLGPLLKPWDQNWSHTPCRIAELAMGKKTTTKKGRSTKEAQILDLRWSSLVASRLTSHRWLKHVSACDQYAVLP